MVIFSINFSQSPKHPRHSVVSGHDPFVLSAIASIPAVISYIPPPIVCYSATTSCSGHHAFASNAITSDLTTVHLLFFQSARRYLISTCYSSNTNPFQLSERSLPWRMRNNQLSTSPPTSVQPLTLNRWFSPCTKARGPIARTTLPLASSRFHPFPP